MAAPDNTRFVIRTAEGMYLGGNATGLRLVNDIYGAVLLDRGQVDIEQALALLRQATGLSLEAVPMQLEQIFETCDQCGRLALPLETAFDGQRFLCPECRK